MAINARKTVCPQGHAYDKKNTIFKKGARRCRTCISRENRIYRKKQRLTVRSHAAVRRVWHCCAPTQQEVGDADPGVVSSPSRSRELRCLTPDRPIDQEGKEAMPKSKNRSHRETRKPLQALPEVPALGNLSMPRKGDRAAAKYVASVGNLWDRRRVVRKARKIALARQEAVSAKSRRQRIEKPVRKRMLTIMAGWSFDPKTQAFMPNDTAPERFEELLDAVIDLGTGTIWLRVSGLSRFEAARVRGYLGTSSVLIAINQRANA